MATHSSILVMKNPTDRGAWQATVHRVSESDQSGEPYSERGVLLSLRGSGRAQQLWLGLTCSAALGILVFQPRVELLSPALQGRFLTTGPPGKPRLLYFNEQTISCFIRANQYQISVFLSHVRCYRLNHHHHYPLYFGLCL